MTGSALEVYDAALAAAARHGYRDLRIGAPATGWSAAGLPGWLAGRPGDGSLVSRCTGPTLDVGCGPGRLTAAVASTGLPALGVDISPTAVRLTRHRGATALCRSVFEPLPAEGRWRHVLLADGNIGIGGHPHRLLSRCRALLGPTGTVLVELDPPGSRSHTATVRLRYGDRQSRPFRWAYLSADDLAESAEAAALRVLDRWTEDGRWFAALAPH